MTSIFPLRAYRYTEKAGDLNDLVTQPYDKISVGMRARYLHLSPYNLVRIILGERFVTDAASDNVYTRANSCLGDWMAQGILAQDPEPAFLPYFQEFEVPDTGERVVRKGFIGLGPVEDYSAGIVHRHEQTLSGPKQDRLELLRQTNAHCEQIFMLYADPERAVDRLLDEAAEGAPIAEVTDEYRAVHRVWRMPEAARIAEIQRLMADKKLLIADGHHRYETALQFRRENPQLAGARRLMMTFVNMHSPGLKILGTHRLVSGLESFDEVQFLAGLRGAFSVVPLRSLATLRERWTEPHPDKIRLGVCLGGARALFLVETGRAEGGLDVQVLHERIIAGLLGINAEAVRAEKHIRYARGADAAAEEALQGNAQIAFLLEPASIDQVARVAFSGGVMPQKSTDFYPKLLSGLATYRLEK